MSLSFSNLGAVPLTETAGLFNRAFSGYFVPIEQTDESLARMIAQQAVNLHLSPVAFVGRYQAGFAMISCRGTLARIAAMGVVPERQRTGIGRQVLQKALTWARDEGFKTMDLEVIEANTRAMALYESMGFQRRRRLPGFEGPVPRGPPEPGLTEVETGVVARVATLHGDPDVTWQVTPESIASSCPPIRAFALGEDAYGMASFSGDGTMMMRALVVPGERRRRGCGRRLVAAMAAAGGSTNVMVPPLIPNAAGAAFCTGIGLVATELAQWELRVSLR